MMEGQDTIALTSSQTAPAEAAKPNFFNEGFGFLGNHHTLDFTLDAGPVHFGKVPLPYMFFDQGSFHYFGSESSLVSTGVYTTDMSKEASPIGEKGKAIRKDGHPIGLDLSITSNLFFLLFGTLITLVVLRTAASKAKKSLVPKGLRNMVEVLIVFVRDDIVSPNVAEPYGEQLLPYFLTTFFFLMIVNLCGLLPYGHTATSSLEITAALAVCTFIVTQVVGIRSQGIKTFLLHLTGGLHEMELSIFMKIFLLLIMVPIEIMGLFTKPFALAIRLFANMTAGHIIIVSLICLTFMFHSLAVGAFVTVPFSLFVYLLEIFVAVLQAYIFTTLSAVFIGMMAHSEHDEHVHDKDLPHPPDGDHLIGTVHA
ncbi:MAG: F0F1 ATP synthase subunit A [Bacteroidota bacterium]|nr:F0F1 ATP synthase subunit A [Bacteroidota bacterium]MDP4233462.1 F0F1 ATP synthase subunit A [Bacteroidota bacterium]MDP4242328.1 F0F1 ATP synthase subunit A [Bacteroidota bacterium]MDP4287084.1 F0F1 ATP synthase subunit A [Bacteroidota bacterium]